MLFVFDLIIYFVSFFPSFFSSFSFMFHCLPQPPTIIMTPNRTHSDPAVNAT